MIYLIVCIIIKIQQHVIIIWSNLGRNTKHVIIIWCNLGRNTTTCNYYMEQLWT